MYFCIAVKIKLIKGDQGKATVEVVPSKWPIAGRNASVIGCCSIPSWCYPSQYF